MTEEKPLTRKEVINIVLERMRAVSARTHASMAQQVFQMQADAAISQANPVSGTKYTVLDTTKNVRLMGLAANITWAVTQPTPLEIHGTVDGVTYLWAVGNPVSGTWYYMELQANADEASQVLQTTDRMLNKSFYLEARSIKLEAEITWATTQPTPLVCRVKYAKIP